MGEHIGRTPGGAQLPAYNSDFGGAAAMLSDAGGPSDRLPTRRAHALGIALLLLCTAAFCVPLWGEIRARLQVRLPDAPNGAVGIGTAIGWSTATLANLVTIGVLGVLFGVLGALALRWRTPGRATFDFTGARRTFTLAWGLYVLAKLAGQGILAFFEGAQLADAVPALMRPDAWLALLFGALLWAARALAGATWPRALATAGILTVLYAGTLVLLPS
ncbi:hypothetical protein [Streptomyces violascens]|uniref:Yip1 domain-containing protein n=1 Tax=Streptomyces violascens TaxID=67381 RepID=A0ABQ3R2E8_9ACTN|nr:hypothetical protein [Streptomyces violascens]GGU31489.1 hypothetical protein GCM10010289_61140 [Streptomyces violascens]GHI43692.1 hypothetical protein Sviol_81000 [Streptomyces violascens]